MIKPSSWPPRTRRIVTAVLVLGAAQAGLLFGYRLVQGRRGSASPAFEAARLDGAVAPAPVVMTSAGRAVAWESLRGKPVLVHFWATWCTPCRDELPALLELARAERGRLHLLAISLDSGWSPVGLFFDGSIPEQVARPIDGGTQRKYGVTTLPDTFVVSSSGRLIERARGARDWSSVALTERLETWEASP